MFLPPFSKVFCVGTWAPGHVCGHPFQLGAGWHGGLRGAPGAPGAPGAQEPTEEREGVGFHGI